MAFDTRLHATATVALPLIALGAAYSFTVNVPGCNTSQVAVVNPPASLLGSLSSWAANVTATGVVTVTLKSGLAIASGNQTFVVGVF